jgi:hypothetical protein
MRRRSEDFQVEQGSFMSQTDWAKTYAKMDKRIILKYEQLPKGEQIGKAPQAGSQEEKKSDRLAVRC